MNSGEQFYFFVVSLVLFGEQHHQPSILKAQLCVLERMVTQSKLLSSQNPEGTFTVNVVMEMFNHLNSLYLMLIEPIKFHSLNSSVSAVVQKDLQWNLIVIF